MRRALKRPLGRALPARAYAGAVALLLFAGATHAERFAVLAVDADHDGGAVPLEAADAVRAALERRGIEMLDADATRALFHRQLDLGGNTVAEYKTQLAKADQALAALDQDASLRILTSVIRALANDPDPSTEKQALLEPARLKLASRLVALAGPKESGNGETEKGREARAILVDALRANPALAPSPDEYPPRFLSLVAAARSDLVQRPTGLLVVDSRPQGATVFLDGRDMGRTPLSLGKDANVVAGSYHVWVELGGARSVPKVITIGESPSPVFVDLAFEGALWQEGPGLRPIAGSGIDEAVARKIGSFLEVDTLLLVGTARYDDDGAWLWGAAFHVGDGTTARRGAVRLADGVAVTAAAGTLAAFLGLGEDDGVEQRPLPPSVLPEKKVSVAGSSTSSPSLSVTTKQVVEGIPWVPVGITAGAVVAAAAVAGGIFAVVALSPKEGEVVFTVEDLK